MRAWLLILLSTAGLATAAEVYRWVDETGQVHFSDRPQEGAERVELAEPTTIAPPAARPARRSARREDEQEQQQPFQYETLAITKPAQEEVFWNIEGQLDVSLQVQPRLQRGHELRLFLDGQPVRSLRPGVTQARLSDVFRGVHVLRAEIRDQNGEVLIESAPVTIMVQQTSILNPNHPNPPPRPAPRAGG